MNGGFIKQQRRGEHQMVTFIFMNELTEDQVEKWNTAIAQLKTTFGANITAMSNFGADTPNFADPEWAKGKR